MIFAVFIHQPVGVVHPAVKRRMVIERAELVAVCRVERIGQLNPAPANGVLRCLANAYKRFLCARRQFERYEIVDTLLCQADIHIRVGGIACQEADLSFRGLLLDRKQEVFGRIRDVDKRQGVALLFQFKLTLAGQLAGYQTERNGCTHDEALADV